jgi:hypothetical protein
MNIFKVAKRYASILKKRIELVLAWQRAARILGEGWDNTCLDCKYYLESDNLSEYDPVCDIFEATLEYDTEWITEDEDGRRVKNRQGGYSVIETVHNCEQCNICEYTGIQRIIKFWKHTKEYTKYF